MANDPAQSFADRARALRAVRNMRSFTLEPAALRGALVEVYRKLAIGARMPHDYAHARATADKPIAAHPSHDTVPAVRAVARVPALHADDAERIGDRAKMFVLFAFRYRGD